MALCWPIRKPEASTQKTRQLARSSKQVRKFATPPSVVNRNVEKDVKAGTFIISTQRISNLASGSSITRDFVTVLFFAATQSKFSTGALVGAENKGSNYRPTTADVATTQSRHAPARGQPELTCRAV
jgi:hypothetical protein